MNSQPERHPYSGVVPGNIGQRLMFWIDQFQRRHAVIAFPWAVYRKYADDSGSRTAAQLAYYSIFSVIPLLLVFTVVVRELLRNDPELRQEVLEATVGAVPGLEDALTQAATTLPASGVPLAIGLLAALWAGIGVIEGSQFAFNQVWAVPWRQRPGFFPRKIRGLIMAFVLGLGFLLYGLLSAFVGASDTLPFWYRVAVMTIAGGLFFVVMLVSYRVLCKRPVAIRQVWPGCLLFVSVVSVVIPYLSWLFSRWVGGLSALYGTMASILALITLFYLISMWFILTSEVNVVLAWHLWPRGIVPDWLSRGDRLTYSLMAPVEERMPEQRVVTYFGAWSDDRSLPVECEPPTSVFRYVDEPPEWVTDDLGWRPKSGR